MRQIAGRVLGPGLVLAGEAHAEMGRAIVKPKRVHIALRIVGLVLLQILIAEMEIVNIITTKTASCVLKIAGHVRLPRTPIAAMGHVTRERIARRVLGTVEHVPIVATGHAMAGKTARLALETVVHVSGAMTGSVIMGNHVARVLPIVANATRSVGMGDARCGRIVDGARMIAERALGIVAMELVMARKTVQDAPVTVAAAVEELYAVTERAITLKRGRQVAPTIAATAAMAPATRCMRMCRSVI